MQFTISYQPFYDSKNEYYTNIYTIDRLPTQPLLHIVRRINAPRLSQFQINNTSHCVFAICNPNNINELLQIGEEAIFFTYISSIGYNIEHSTTKILKNIPSVDNKRLLCIISK